MASHLNMIPSMDVALPWPGYMIYRPVGLNEEPDLTASPIFFPAKDSDELFDALRVKYPHVKSHSERMRDAIIEFLIEERQAERLQQTNSMTNSFVSTTSPETMPLEPTRSSPWQQSWPSMSSNASSSWSSPETHGLATPSFGDSPRPAQMSQAATATPSGSSNGPTPAPLEQMTGVFSLSTTTQPKQRVRRKMTESEKVEYRARRIVKACDKCAKRKRKCQHNQPEVNQLTTKPSSKKKSCVIPTSANIMRAPSVHPQQPLDFDFDMFCVDESLTMDDTLFDGLYDLNEHVMSNVDIDHKTPFDSTFGTTHSVNGLDPLQDWQWSDQQDWRSRDNRSMNQTGLWSDASVDNHYQLMVDNGNNPQQPLPFPPALDAGNWSGNSRLSSPQFSQVSDTDVVLNTDQYPHATIDTVNRHNLQSGNLDTIQEPGRQQQVVEAPEPTHTLHAHSMNRQSLRTVGNAEPQAPEDISPPNQKTLPQTVLRLTGSAERASNSNSMHSASIQSVSTDKAMDASTASEASQSLAISGKDDATGTHVTMTTVDARHNKSTRTSSDPLALCKTHKKSNHRPTDRDQAASPTNAAPGSRPIRGSSPLQGAESIAHQGRLVTQRSLAENMDRVASPSTELYMLKRRVPGGSRLRTTSQALQTSVNNATSTDDSRANGGAYPRLTTSDFTHLRSPRLKHQRITTDNYTKPNATRAPVATGNAIYAPAALLIAAPSTTPNATHAPAALLPATPSTTQNGRTCALAPSKIMASQLMPSYHMLCKDHHGRDVTYANRLCDHWRYRDHHGRSSSAAISSAHRTTLLLFAVIAVAVLAVYTDASTALPFTALAVLVQCTTKNSSWLAGPQGLSSKASRALHWTRLRESLVLAHGAGLRAKSVSSRLQITR